MIVLYARVSAAEQITEPQLTQAAQAGFKVDTVMADDGVSGVSTRLAERPGLFDMRMQRLTPHARNLNPAMN